MRLPVIFISLSVFLLFTGTAFAGRPLITDDADTQGKGKYLLEIAGEYAHDDDDDVRANRSTLCAELDYGLTNNLDFTIASAYQALQTNNEGVTDSSTGIADSLVELKWRFYDNKNGLRF